SDTGARGVASASGQAQSVSLFGGEITADAVTGKANGSTLGRAARGSLASSSISNLVVLGQPAAASPNGRIALADWGYMTTLEQGTDTSAGPGGAQAFDGFVTGLDVHLTAPHANLPAGSEIQVGYAEAEVQAPATTSSRRSARRSSPSPTGSSSPSAGTRSAATDSGSVTRRGTSSTTRTSRPSRHWPGTAGA